MAKRGRPPKWREEDLKDEGEPVYGDLLTEMELETEGEKLHYGHRRMEEKLASLPPEDDRPKKCPRCGKRGRVRSKNVERTFQSLSGTHTIRRNHHYCEDCKSGFYPLDDLLGLPEEGDLSAELEKRVLDFAISEVYAESERRWELHYGFRLSSNQFRQVAKRLGVQIEACDPNLLQLELFASNAKAAEVLHVFNDGGMVSTRTGWREIKVGVVVRGDRHVERRAKGRGQITDARYVAVLGDQQEFKREMCAALDAEKWNQSKKVAWVADGAPENWILAELVCPTAIQILDWYHAVENGMTCAKVLLDEGDPLLPLWKVRLESLLHAGRIDELIRELVECIPLIDDANQMGALDQLVGYYRKNEARMRYDDFLSRGLMIGSGVVESAHRHVIQKRMKLAGQHWEENKARQMARLRAAYRTAGPERFHSAIRRAHRLRSPTRARRGCPKIKNRIPR